MSGITAAQVGAMADEELADMLNERWRMVVLLLNRAGGTATWTRAEVADTDVDVTLITYERLSDQAVVLEIGPKV